MKHDLALLAIILAALLIAGPITAEERIAFLVGGDPQYLAEKSEFPTRLDPFSEQAAVRLVQILDQFPGRDIPQRLDGVF